MSKLFMVTAVRTSKPTEKYKPCVSYSHLVTISYQLQCICTMLIQVFNWKYVESDRSNAGNDHHRLADMYPHILILS
jgi:hypothetical protein